jgi:NADPH-dependent 2,4-dienoyl-CoA reductase/sulfur reductase-like enzyme
LKEEEAMSQAERTDEARRRPTRFPLLIIGGGLASARAIRSYRESGGDGRIALVSRDETLPYHRPPLSKRYLRGEAEPDDTLVEPPSFYADHDVELYLETAVTGVDPGEHAVDTDDGARLRYERLLVATGASPRRLGVPGASLDRIFTLRTLADATAIREAAREGGRAVVVGGGFIGMEVAASLRELELDVTLVHREGGLFDQFGSAQLSETLAALYRERGVDVLLGEEVARFGGDRGVAFAETARGRRIAADLVVVGVGVSPSIDFLADSGLALENGVVVDERFETSAPGIYAVGDVASFFDPLYGRRRRIEHWSNANYQGTAVGKLLAGSGSGYDTVSSFFTEIFGITIKVFGDVSRFDDVRTEGSLASGRFFARYGDGGRLVGAATVGQSREFEATVKALIAERAPLFADERHLVVAA